MEILLTILIIILFSAFFHLPIILYRFAIKKTYLQKKKAFIVAIIYNVVWFSVLAVFWFLLDQAISSLLNDSSLSPFYIINNPILGTCIHYSILKKGCPDKAKYEIEYNNTSDPQETQDPSIPFAYCSNCRKSYRAHQCPKCGTPLTSTLTRPKETRKKT